MTDWLDEAEAACEAATEGPWDAVKHDDPRGQPVPYYRGIIATFEYGDDYLALALSEETGRSVPKEQWEQNLVFCSVARTVLPRALKALRAADELAKKFEGWDRSTPSGTKEALAAYQKARGLGLP